MVVINISIYSKYFNFLQSYVEAMSDQKISVQWIALTKRLLVTVSNNLKHLQPTIKAHLNAIALYLHVLVSSFTRHIRFH